MKKVYAVLLSWLLAGAGLGRAQSQNESEPNNGFTQANAIELGRDIKAALPQGDQDYFKVIIDKPGILNVAVESVPKELSVGVEIFRPPTPDWMQAQRVVDSIIIPTPSCVRRERITSVYTVVLAPALNSLI